MMFNSSLELIRLVNKAERLTDILDEVRKLNPGLTEEEVKEVGNELMQMSLDLRERRR